MSDKTDEDVKIYIPRDSNIKNEPQSSDLQSEQRP